MKFKKEFMQERVLCGGDGVEIIYDEIVDTSRWTITYELVFKFEDCYYRTFYDRGATEYQDEGPYENEGDEINVQEVFPREVKELKYLTKEECENNRKEEDEK